MFSSFFGRKAEMVSPDQALAGRADPMLPHPERHAVLGTPIVAPFPDGIETAVFGLGCFWGAEKLFWETPGVYSTAVGYAGGTTPNPTYDEVCSGRTGQTEVVLVAFDPDTISYRDLLRRFWEDHDPTQGMRQGNDVGSQYRSAIYYADDAQRRAAEETRDAYQAELTKAGYGEITTEIAPAGPFYYAEDYHQQYLHKVPNGYCPHNGTGVGCPVSLGVPLETGAASGGLRPARDADPRCRTTGRGSMTCVRGFRRGWQRWGPFRFSWTKIWPSSFAGPIARLKPGLEN